jgi:hypothetical protein
MLEEIIISPPVDLQEMAMIWIAVAIAILVII